MNWLSLLPICEGTYKCKPFGHHLNTKENEIKSERVGGNDDVLKSLWNKMTLDTRIRIQN